jgi:hypothetical protein
MVRTILYSKIDSQFCFFHRFLLTEVVAEPRTNQTALLNPASSTNKKFMKEMKLNSHFFKYCNSNTFFKHVKEPVSKCLSFMDFSDVEILGEPRANLGEARAVWVKRGYLTLLSKGYKKYK